LKVKSRSSAPVDGAGFFLPNQRTVTVHQSNSKKLLDKEDVMRINQKIKYGVACLFELSKTPIEFRDAGDISTKQNIPPAYAQKVLQSMAHAGLIFALKGVGYRLTRPLSRITALEVMEALTVEMDPNATNPDIGVLLEKRVNEALGSFTLAELISH
jgi:Rrf2 family protein